MNFNKINDINLHEQTKLAAKKEKSATIDLLQHLSEVSKRVLYADLGHSTLQKYVIKELGYSEGESWIRIQAMRLIRSSDYAKEKIEQGTLSFSNAASVQQFLAEVKADDAEKIEEIINLGVNKSNRDLRAELEKKAGKIITDKKVTLRKNILDKIKRLNILLDADMTELETIESALDQVIKQQELKMETHSMTCEKRRVNSKTASKGKGTRYIPVQVRRAIVAHANHQCEFKDHNGKRCSERRNLQFDHLKPFALGGESTQENIQLLCWAHNQRRMIKTFGYKSSISSLKKFFL